MHKPRRRTKYFERFYFEYEGILYLSKKIVVRNLDLSMVLF